MTGTSIQAMAKAHVPEAIRFATKPAIALAMIERAIAANVPFSWVAADSVYGVGDIKTALRCAGKGYVLGVNANHPFRSWGMQQAIAGTAKDIAESWPISTPAATTAFSETLARVDEEMPRGRDRRRRRPRYARGG